MSRGRLIWPPWVWPERHSAGRPSALQLLRRARPVREDEEGRPGAAEPARRDEDVVAAGEVIADADDGERGAADAHGGPGVLQHLVAEGAQGRGRAVGVHPHVVVPEHGDGGGAQARELLAHRPDLLAAPREVVAGEHHEVRLERVRRRDGGADRRGRGPRADVQVGELRDAEPVVRRIEPGEHEGRRLRDGAAFELAGHRGQGAHHARRRRAPRRPRGTAAYRSAASSRSWGGCKLEPPAPAVDSTGGAHHAGPADAPRTSRGRGAAGAGTGALAPGRRREMTDGEFRGSGPAKVRAPRSPPAHGRHPVAPLPREPRARAAPPRPPRRAPASRRSGAGPPAATSRGGRRAARRAPSPSSRSSRAGGERCPRSSIDT